MDPAVRDVLPLHPKEPSNSRGKSEGTSEYRCTGKEPYVFRADKPGDLFGVHVDLMEKTLCRDEGLLYLLYSPIFPEEKGPFGLCAAPGSHAVAVTKHRFIISEDRHMEGIAPTIQSIPFDQVFYVELGNALLLGWFSIEFIVDDKPSCATLFFTATGIEHFESLIREYRRNTVANCDRFSKKIDWVDVWHRTPMTQVDRELQGILGLAVFCSCVFGRGMVYLVRNNLDWRIISIKPFSSFHLHGARCYHDGHSGPDGGHLHPPAVPEYLFLSLKIPYRSF